VNRVIKAMALPESFGKILATTVKERSLQRKDFEGFDKPEHLPKLLALRKILESETKPAPPQPPAVTREGDGDVDLGTIYTGPGEDNGKQDYAFINITFSSAMLGLLLTILR
jgi:hypothetical protein